jgi:ABC-2 type transport system ATP-binding protein
VLALKARGVAVLLNSHLIGEWSGCVNRVVILDRGRVAAPARGRAARSARAPAAPDAPSPAAEARLMATGKADRVGEWVTVALAGRRPRHRPSPSSYGTSSRSARTCTRVEPGRISLEERLLGILRAGADARAGGEQ